MTLPPITSNTPPHHHPAVHPAGMPTAPPPPGSSDVTAGGSEFGGILTSAQAAATSGGGSAEECTDPTHNHGKESPPPLPKPTPSPTPPAGVTMPPPGAQPPGPPPRIPSGAGVVMGQPVSGGGNAAPQRLQKGNQPLDIKLPTGATITIAAQSQPHVAPAVNWGSGWREVTGRNGAKFMRHTSGERAYVSDQIKLVAHSPGRIQIVATPFGQGKKFPDGTVLVPGVGGHRQPHRLSADGKIYPLDFGRHTFGGVRVDVVRATVVQVVDAGGTRRRYDSRGMLRFPQRAAGAGALGVQGGGPMNTQASQLKATVEGIAQTARAVLEQAEATGKADPSLLASIRSVLASLPAALNGAIAGMTHVAGGGGSAGSSGVSKPPSTNPFRSIDPLPLRAPRSGERVQEYLKAVSSVIAAHGLGPSQPPASRSASGSVSHSH
jgi:hypothetical protein